MTNMKFKERHFKLCFLTGKKLKLLTLASTGTSMISPEPTSPVVHLPIDIARPGACCTSCTRILK